MNGALLAAVDTSPFVELDVPPWAWLVLVSVVITLLVADLLIVHRRPHAISFREAAEVILFADKETLIRLTVLPKRKRTGRPRKMKYRGKNHRIMKNRPEKQRRVA